MSIDTALLHDTLRRLRSEAPEGVEASLDRIVDATRSVFSVTGAGLMFLDEADDLRYVAASDEAVRILEVAQEQTGDGPCVDALLGDRTVATPDITADQRWPELARRMKGTGVRAVLGTPVHLGASSVGSLNVYSDGELCWADDEIAAIRAFAEVIEQAIGLAVAADRDGTLVAQLQRALDHRVVIERAVGMLMEREDLDSVRAFNKLRRTARDAGRKVIDVAGEVVGAPFEAVASGADGR